MSEQNTDQGNLWRILMEFRIVVFGEEKGKKQSTEYKRYKHKEEKEKGNKKSALAGCER